MRKILTAAFLSIGLLASMRAQQPNLPYVQGEVIVKFRATADQSRRNIVMAARAARLIRRFDAVAVDHVRLVGGQTVEQAVAAFSATPDVEAAQPNYVRQAVGAAPPNDPFWVNGSMWGLERIQVKPVWDRGMTGDGTVVIADIDTGINYNHPDLAVNLWRNSGEIAGNHIDDDHDGYVDDVFGIDTYNHDSDPMDDNGHGTHTAGTMAAAGNNGIGIPGINWSAKILSCKFLNAQGSGFDSDAIECFNYVTMLKNRGVNIRATNNSWGGSRGAGPVPTALKSAIDSAGAAGIVNVVAAGNLGIDTDSQPVDPASLTSASIVAVAASDSADARASFSNYGATSIDLAAPGVNIVSTYGGGYATTSGTSMAAPHVAGAAALLASANASLSVASIKALLLDNVDWLSPWSGQTVSGGRLNVLRAMNSVSDVTAPSLSNFQPTNGAVVGGFVTLSVTATDDVSVVGVRFTFDGAALGAEVRSAPYTVGWDTGTVSNGPHTLTATARDGAGHSQSTSVVLNVSNTGQAPINVALASRGGVATASSSFSNYGPAGVNDGDRKGLNWGNGGGWNDATGNAWPDWVEVAFAGLEAINEVGVVSVQDNYTNPVEPPAWLTFSQYGVTDFTVQYWDGTQWLAVPNGTVAGNTLVRRQVMFGTTVTTTKIRVLVTGGLGGYSRIIELEAYRAASGASSNTPPTVTLTGPVEGAALTASAAVALAAAAADPDGVVTRVDFYVDGTLWSSDATSPYAATWSTSVTGNHTVTAVAVDNAGATTTSAPVTVSVSAAAPRTNVALASRGGVATASSSFSNYGPAGVNDGDRKGLNWGNGGGWNDATGNAWPDWVEVAFAGLEPINEVDVMSVQDNYTAPSEPSSTLAFSLYGVTDFTVQYWDGTQWLAVPNGTVAGNTLVRRAVVFGTVTTTKIRVLVTGALAGYSRLIEIEAYRADGSSNTPPTVTLTGPVEGAPLTAPAAVALAAAAADADGAVTRVDFYVDGALWSSDATSPYAATWSTSVAGTHTLAAVAVDNSGATTTSAPVTVSVSAAAPRTNVALASRGGVATASSSFGNYGPAGANDGDRKGLNWGNGGGWNDATGNTWPDWVEVAFAAPEAINEVDVMSVQDNYTAPSEPSSTLTFNQYGVTDFTVQYWDGTQWLAVPNGTVTGNTRVWRQVVFGTTVTTSRIRVVVTGGVGGYSRIIEIEAYRTDP